MRPITRYAIAILISAIIPVAALIHVAKTANAVAQTDNNNLGFAPGTYRGVIADASPANTNNYVRVDRRSAVIHLEAISSIVLPN
jgi:hypothetical protein